jgi:hypothetical protein
MLRSLLMTQCRHSQKPTHSVPSDRMDDYRASKEQPSESFQSIAEHLSEQPEPLDRSFLSEYFYWSWRCLLFVLFLVVCISLASGDPPIQYLGRISGRMWAVLILAPLMIGPLVFVGWSYLWMWGQDALERLRK